MTRRPLSHLYQGFCFASQCSDSRSDIGLLVIDSQPRPLRPSMTERATSRQSVSATGHGRAGSGPTLHTIVNRHRRSAALPEGVLLPCQ